jgi:hypothetical protein
MATLRDVPVSSHAVNLARALSSHANAAGECWPSVRTLAHECRLSERSVQRALRELEASCLLERVTRVTPAGDPTSNLYRLRFGFRSQGPVEPPPVEPPSPFEALGEPEGGAHQTPPGGVTESPKEIQVSEAIQDPPPSMVPPEPVASEPLGGREGGSREEGASKDEDEVAAGAEAPPEVSAPVLEAARRAFPTMARTALARFVGRLVALEGLAPTDDELARYLRVAARDPSLTSAKVPVAAACTADRFVPWLEAQRRAAARAQAAVTAPPRPVRGGPLPSPVAEANGPVNLAQAAGALVARLTGARGVAALAPRPNVEHRTLDTNG